VVTWGASGGNSSAVASQLDGTIDVVSMANPFANDKYTDTTPPTIAISTSDSDLTWGESATLTFTLSEASTNFVAGDVTVSGGTLSAFAGSGTSYSATFAPAADSTANGVIRVASGKFTDSANNANPDGADANNTVTMSVNTTGTGTTGTPEDDVLYGGPGSDAFLGLDGDDLFIGNAGNDNLDGGAGLDIAIYSGNRSAHTIARSGGSMTVSGGADGTDSLVNIERLVFDDIGLAFDIDGTAGQAYRIYQAAFNRTPDIDGLSFWIYSMDSGVSLREVAKGFIASAEFESQYGANPTNYQLTTLLYNNVLHRDPDQGGYDYSTSQLDNGLAREDALAFFAESPENQTALIGVIQDGITYFEA